MQYFKDAVITDDLQKYFVLIKLRKSRIRTHPKRLTWVVLMITPYEKLTKKPKRLNWKKKDLGHI